MCGVGEITKVRFWTCKVFLWLLDLQKNSEQHLWCII
jgi:hypothetical protein